MVEHEPIRKHILKKTGLFRAEQKTAAMTHDEELQERPNRELREILSPFWAWRALNR